VKGAMSKNCIIFGYKPTSYNCTEKTEECESEDTRYTEMVGLQKPSHPQPEWEEKDIEDDCFADDNLLHSLANMSLNLFVDQVSDADNPFCNCDWQLKESVIMSEKADISYSNLFLKTLKGCKYVASRQNEICLESTMSAKLTIFHGTFRGMVTNDSESGVPIVYENVSILCSNTAGSSCSTSTNQLLSCLFQMYDRKKIHISADDPEKSSLIFYMSQKRDGLRYFESALHRGWFIHTINDNDVKMQRGNNASSSCFVFE
uniref:Si:ch73-226l13.2 n=1 Tax=Sinocyclocheilus anshuiensis TaxID=1608454 RepID=A0A671NTU8_9TELE